MVFIQYRTTYVKLKFNGEVMQWFIAEERPHSEHAIIIYALKGRKIVHAWKLIRVEICFGTESRTEKIHKFCISANLHEWCAQKAIKSPVRPYPSHFFDEYVLFSVFYASKCQFAHLRAKY